MEIGSTIQKTEAVVEQTKKTLAALRENNILKMYVDGSVLQFMAGDAELAALIVDSTTAGMAPPVACPRVDLDADYADIASCDSAGKGRGN